jgi:23S rRNA (guanosine2251-2'-O)-methyltransferase
MLIYGKQSFLYVLDNLPEKIEEIYLSKEIDRKLFSKVSSIKKPIIKLDNKKAQALAKGNNHQGYFLKTKELELYDYKELMKKDFLLVLVGLTDMGNIGSIIRTSYSLGVDGIIISGIKNIKNDILVRTSSGAAWSMPMASVSNTAELVNELSQKDFELYGSCLDGEDINNVSRKNRKVLFLGSEDEGIPNRILNKLQKVSIKMKNNFNSLNVSNAAAILIDRVR